MKRLILILVLVFGVVGGGREAWAETASVEMEMRGVLAEEIIRRGENKAEERGSGLQAMVDTWETTKWNGVNSLRILIARAVDTGVSAETVVLLLLLPLVATIVSVIHYVFGWSGYGIFMPTMIGVTFLTTGIPGGLVLFVMILVVTMMGNMVLRKLKLHFWPMRSINLMLIGLGTFGLMLVSAKVRLLDLSQISIYPVLLMILLVEEFSRTQLVKSKKEAKRLTLGTLALAILGAGLMGIREIQRLVMANPELVVLIVVAVNLVVGSYRGIRLTEIKRFGMAIREKS